ENEPFLDNILDNHAPQLGALVTPTTGPAYYPLLPGSQVVNAGTNSVVDNIIDMGAVEFNAANAALNFVFSPPALTVSSSTTSVNLEVTVSDSSGPINGPLTGGTITFSLLNASNVPVAGSVTAPVSSIGQATTTFNLPSNLPAGNYTVKAVYNSTNGQFNNSSGTETLTKLAAPLVAAGTTLTAGDGSVVESASSQTT